MQNNTEIKKLLEEIKEDYRYDIGDIFPDKDNKCTLYDSFLSDTKKFITDDRPVSMVFDTLENISHWHLSVSQYKALTNDSKGALTEYISALSYGYLYMKANIEVWEYLKPNDSVYMDNAIMFLSQTIISSWHNEGSLIANSLLESIGYKKRDDIEHDKIIGTGTNKSSVSWFILELFCQSKDIEFIYDDAVYPKNMQVYQKVLMDWDTKNLTKLEQLVYLLAEHHLEQIKNLEGTDRYYHEFGDSFRWLFPYEILVWLKLREKAGLINPKTFSHSLMNTPIAKMFLEIKEPLSKPTELPYAKELLEKLKEKCPDIEIPEWLDEEIEIDQG